MVLANPVYDAYTYFFFFISNIWSYTAYTYLRFWPTLTVGAGTGGGLPTLTAWWSRC